MKKTLLIAISILINWNTSFAQTGEALNFDGSNDYVAVGTLLTANTSYTKEAWIYVTISTGNRNILSSSHNPFWIQDNRLKAGNNNNYTVVIDPTNISLNTWVHVAVTYDAASTTMKLYRNGVMVNQNTSSPVYASQANFIGSHTGGNSTFSGSIDEMRVWNRALSQSEIQNSITGCGVPTSGTGLVANYHFDQGAAGGTNSGVTTLTDASGNENHGSVINFALSGSTSNWVAPGPVISSTGPTLTATPQSGDLIWKGTTNTDWLTTGNWYHYNGSTYATATAVPGANTNIIIPANHACVTTQPNVVGNTVNVKNITIENGANLTIVSGTLNVSGNWTNNGTYTPGSGVVNFEGTTAQTIGGSVSTTFYNMGINNNSTGITLNVPVSVSNALTMAQGNINTTSINLLTVGGNNITNSINWTAGTIVGPLKRWFTTSINTTQASGIFPIGNSTHNRYAQINFTQAPGSTGYIIAEYNQGRLL